MRKRAIIIITLVVLKPLATLMYLSPAETGAHQASLASFRGVEQAGFTYVIPEDIDIVYSIIQDLAANSLTPCEEIGKDDVLYDLSVHLDILQQMIDEASVLTYRRGILMENANLHTPFYQLDRQLWSCSALLAQALLATVGFSCDNHAQNQRVITALMGLSDICSDYTRIEVTIELMLGMLPVRQALTPSQLEFLYALEGFKAMVNAPFWEDMYSNDPVITHIGVPISSLLRCPFFTIWLYDPDLKELTNCQLAEYAMDIREEILEFIGLDAYPFEFRVARFGDC